MRSGILPSSRRSVMTRRSRSASDKRVAEGDQPAGRSRLRLGKLLRHHRTAKRSKMHGPIAALLQHVEIEEVDRQDVVERLLDRREEARPRAPRTRPASRRARRDRAGRSTRDCCGPCGRSARSRSRQPSSAATSRAGNLSAGDEQAHIRTRLVFLAPSARSRRRSSGRPCPSSRCAPCRRSAGTASSARRRRASRPCAARRCRNSRRRLRRPACPARRRACWRPCPSR